MNENFLRVLHGFIDLTKIENETRFLDLIKIELKINKNLKFKKQATKYN